jgi:glycosyltransferase involved in cell wall biosynthesis
MAEISIIVPVYNVEKYLRQAIESLQNQSFSDFEAILVNDGSPDNCLKIMQDYANKDNRFIVLNQGNQGPGQSRNNALKIAKSPYITFLDPDDYLGKDFLRNLYEEITKNNADIVETSYTRFFEKTGITKAVNLKLLEENIDYTKDINEDYLFYPTLAVWNKIYKREFLEKNNISFSKNPVNEDVLFTVKARFLAD